MSSFIVGERTLNRIVTHLQKTLKHDRYLIEDTARKYGIHLSGLFWETNLVRSMQSLNRRAVYERYDRKERVRSVRFHAELDVSPIQALKSLQCWLYQCTEGSVPETDLYKFFRELEGVMAVNIVEQLPEWEAAEWG